MSFFGAVRLYVVGADRIERDLALSDGGSVPPSDDGAWALWAGRGDSGGEMNPLPPVSRVDPGPLRNGGGEMDPPCPVSRVDPGPVHIAHAGRIRPDPHDQAMVFDSAASRTGHEIWCADPQMATHMLTR